MKRPKHLFALLTAFLMLLSACAGTAPTVPSTIAPTAAPTEVPTEASTLPPTEALTEPPTEAPDEHAVDSPYLEYPVYTFDHEPSIDEMRAAAVDLMRKALTVEWYTPETFEATTSVSKFTFTQYEPYAGIPYTGANASLYGFLAYMNLNTGRFLIDELVGNQTTKATGEIVQSMVGASCSGTAAWAILAVANSIHGRFQCYYMVYKNGWLPLGDYRYPFSTTTEFGRSPATDTVQIAADAGTDVMFDAYSLLQPADVLVVQDMNKMGHTMMATSVPVIVRTENGKIDGEQSYVLIQDQRFNGKPIYDPVTGKAYTGQGRIDYPFTFQNLYEQGYLPMTVAEFQGTKPYEYPEVKLNKEKTFSEPSDLNGVMLKSNYPIAVVELFATNKATGLRKRANVKVFNRRDVEEETAYKFYLNQFGSKLEIKGFLDPGVYQVTVEVRMPNGEVIIPIEFEYTVS